MRTLPLPVLTALLLGACGGGGGPTAAGVVINEVKAVSGDYVELMNATASSRDLSGVTLTDGNGAPTPRPDEALVFPEGTELAAGQMLLIVANLGSSAGTGPQTDCLAGAAPSCFHARFGVSNTDGDNLFLVDPDGTVVETLDYPSMVVAPENGYGRVPDGTGDFVATLPTPGRPNIAAP